MEEFKKTTLVKITNIRGATRKSKNAAKRFIEGLCSQELVMTKQPIVLVTEFEDAVDIMFVKGNLSAEFVFDEFTPVVYCDKNLDKHWQITYADIPTDKEHYMKLWNWITNG